MRQRKYQMFFLLSYRKILFFCVLTQLFSVSLLHAADNMAFLQAINLLLLQGDDTICGISYFPDSDPKYDLVYKGLHYYRPDMPHTSYGMEQLTDSQFSSMSMGDKRKVADKLLSSLFFGYPDDVLKEKLNSGYFLCSIRKGLLEEKNNMALVEEEIRNEDRYYHSQWAENEVYDILARFYGMEYLDKHYLHNWMAYILTQTIMFSPAYELDSSHYPNVASVYNWQVMDMNEDMGMRYSTYLHMSSTDNWRRFRSPEDNGREMLEIFTFDFDDANVPKAAMTLQNWYLDEDHDTLVVGLNENTIPQDLFGTTVTTGFDFYWELVKSDGFVDGSVRRLVDSFFTDYNDADKARVTALIVASTPETWQDILLQIVFSKEYLLYNARAKSGEELFYSLIKKLEYKHFKWTFDYFMEALERMHQASMKYKLGKLERTPLDTLSFAEYHKYIRETIVIRSVCGAAEDVYDTWDSYGWRADIYGDDRFSYDDNSPIATLTSFITYLFEFMIHRPPTTAELDMFLDNMMEHGEYRWSYRFWVQEDEPYTHCYPRRENATEEVLDYLSRLSELYMYQEVQ